MRHETFVSNYSHFLYRDPSRYKSAWFKPFKRMDGFCGALYHNAVVTHDGYVTLCTELDSDSLTAGYAEPFFVGHIDADFNPFLTEKSILFSKQNSVERLTYCSSCIIRYKCGGGCYIKRVRDFNGDIEKFHSNFCEPVIKLNLSYLIGCYDSYE